MTTAVRKERTRSAQQVARFTGEGAYHGSTRSRPASTSAAQRPAPPPVDEVRPTTLDRLAADDRPVILPFDAHFPNLFRVLEELPVPTEEAIQADRVTFVWSPFAEALDQAGPLTRSVLEAMRPHLTGRKRHIYIDSKIQFFAAGDVPVDSQHWHLDGTIVARDERAKRLGHPLLHDMRARLEGPAEPPIYLAYQSSTHCATRFLGAPLDLRLPELIPDFDELDRLVRALDPPALAQPPASIARFDGRTLHRAVAAERPGWRLWIRCVETDREILPDPSIVECYGTVYRPLDRGAAG